jgi:hypothetical protein
VLHEFGKDDARFEDASAIGKRQSFNICSSINEKIEHEEHNMIFRAGVLHDVETRPTVFIEGDEFAVDNRLFHERVIERRRDRGKFIAEVFAVFRNESGAARILDALRPVSVELQLIDSVVAFRELLDRQALHRRREWNPLLSFWWHRSGYL